MFVAPRCSELEALDHCRRRHLDVARDLHPSEHLDRQPGRVELEPAQPMTSGERESVMVVVPSLTPAEQCDPPIVCRLIAGVERSIAAMVCSAVHQPCDVIGDYDSNEDPPDDPRPSANRK